MIVELVEGDDIRARPVALGFRTSQGACPETCARMALRKHVEVGVPGLEALVHVAQADIVLPPARPAIERFLLPEWRH